MISAVLIFIHKGCSSYFGDGEMLGTTFIGSNVQTFLVGIFSLEKISGVYNKNT